MNDTFMKTRPVFPLLLSMALPNVISMLVNSLYNIVDSLFVAQISEQAMTALSLVFPIQNFVNAVAIGFGIGINAQIALYLGAGDHENANRAATHGMMFSLLHGVLGMVLCIAIMPGFLRRFTTDPTLVDMGVTYSTIVFLFSLVNMADLAFEKIFQSVGRMNVAMVALITGCVTNIALDPVLIFGLGPVPALGIAGAALATGIGQAVSLVVYLYVYCTTEVAVRFSRRCLRFDAALDGKLYAIGVPAILNLALPSLLVTFLNGLLAVYSQSYVTVLGIYYKLQTFLYLPANGIVQGMRPLVGYNYGAREHGRVSRLYNLTLGLSAGIMAIGTLLCLTIAGPLMGLFTSNPETIAIGQTALRIICLGFIVSAVSTTSSGALEGLGKGVPSLVISLCRYIIFIMPIAWVLCGRMGPTGVWHAFWITESLSAVIAYAVYHKAVHQK
uniref:MATE family efflux transporter n=1 Tax=Faecalibacterium sp. TaxID=1971605 RepID=UPI004029D1E0